MVLTASEFKALKHLSKNKNIVIQKPDKGNTIVILDKISYISAIEEILNDHTKFSNLDIPAGKKINYKTNLEKRIISDLKLVKHEEIIDKATYKNIKPVGSRPGVLYGLGKAHKETNNGLAPFRLILSAIGTPNYKVAKFLLPFLTPLTQNEYTVVDSFHLVEEICKQDPNLYMASLEIGSLFTNITLDETIDICIDSLYKDDGDTPKIPKDVFRNLYTVVTKESFFMKENDGPLFFSNVNIFREKGKFVTNFYPKKTFSGAYTNFGNFIAEIFKTGFIKSLLFRCFDLCSYFVKFHHEINTLKSILYKNSYPRDFVDKFTKEFLDRVLKRKVLVSTVLGT